MFDLLLHVAQCDHPGDDPQEHLAHTGHVILVVLRIVNASTNHVLLRILVVRERQFVDCSVGTKKARCLNSVKSSPLCAGMYKAGDSGKNYPRILASSRTS